MHERLKGSSIDEPFFYVIHYSDFLLLNLSQDTSISTLKSGNFLFVS